MYLTTLKAVAEENNRAEPQCSRHCMEEVADFTLSTETSRRRGPGPHCGQ
jgi:hypothetical protein